MVHIHTGVRCYASAQPEFVYARTYIFFCAHLIPEGDSGLTRPLTESFMAGSRFPIVGVMYSDNNFSECVIYSFVVSWIFCSVVDCVVHFYNTILY
jgi:hypothetical protein